MITMSSMRTGLVGLVGFRQNVDPDYPTIATSLATTRSGRYVNDIHSLLTIENIDQCLTNYETYTYTAFNVGTEYSLGDKVSESSVNYEYINGTPTTGNTPPDATYWRVIDSFNDHLTRIYNRGIDNLLDGYKSEKKNRQKVKSIFSDVLLFSGVANFRDVETNADKFVGLRIRLKKGERHLSVILNKLGHQFNAAFASQDIKLYHSSSQSAIATWTIAHSVADVGEWTTLSTNNTLQYLNDYDAGGDFYIGYKQSELEANSAEALNKDIVWNEAPCSGCDSGLWGNYYKQYSPYVDIMGFSILESDMTGDKLLDPSKITLEGHKTFGLNLNLTTKCDLSVFMLQEEEIMSEALAYSIALILLEEIANSTRGNTIPQQIREQARRELYNHNEAWGTVYDKSKKAIKAMEFDFSGMDNACMPEDDPRTFDIETGSV